MLPGFSRLCFVLNILPRRAVGGGVGGPAAAAGLARNEHDITLYE